MTFIRRMYGISNEIKKIINSEPEREKRAVKVLAGMKIHNSHIKRIQIGDELIDVPKIEYMKLLDGQIKEYRQRTHQLETRMIKIKEQNDRLQEEIRLIKRELNQKNILRM